MAIYDRKDDYEFVRWAAAIKQRDHYTCQVCERRGVALNAHHLYAWASYPDLRYELDNGITLCSYCHEGFHEIYGKGANTKEQFNEFVKISKELFSEANYNVAVEESEEKALKFLDGYDVVEQIIADLEKNNV